MSSSPPPEQRPVVSLVDERERVIQQLSDHFANDRLSLDELEARMDLAYKAATVTDLQRLTADLPSVTAAAPVPVAAPARELAGIPAPPGRPVPAPSETRRPGAGVVRQRLAPRS